MAEPITVCIPRESVNDETALILSWKVPSGSFVEKGQLVCELETSKTVLELHAPVAGRLEYSAACGDELPVATPICHIVPADYATAPEPDSATVTRDLPPSGAARLSAAARNAAAKYNIDPASFPPGTLVRSADILRLAGTASAVPTADSAQIRWNALPRRKLVEAGILERGRTSALQSSVTKIWAVGQLSDRLRKLSLAAAGIQPVVIFETARLLRKYPEFNATHDRGRIGYYEQVNIGWAIDGGKGLSVPVIRNADTRGIQEIAALMQSQLEGYLSEHLPPGDLAGATFTVSDLSGFGASLFQPLIPERQSAILGIGSGPPSPADGYLSLTLSFDHRLSEGKRAAGFLRDLSARLEEHGATVASDPAPAPYCMVCQRDGKTLQRHKLILLRSEVPRGYVCSLCIAGW